MSSSLEEFRGRRESRVPAAPAASYVNKSKTYELHSLQVLPSIRLSLHDGLTAYSVLSPAAHCAPVIATNVSRLVTRLSDFAFVQLERQPWTSGPHGFAVRIWH